MRRGEKPLTIDTKMHGYEGITAAFVVRAEKTALVETGPKSAVENLLLRLDQLGVDSLDWIIATHVHLDHAGAAGTLARRFPAARIAVHGVGAPHLVDPSKLWASASRIYGDAMEPLWGGLDPVSRDRVEVLEDGDKIDLGDRFIQAIETPGHARHHHALLDDATGTLFAGDALGVRLPEVGIARPATPPPEFNLEDSISSIERIRSLRPTTLWLTHFGPSHEGHPARDVDEMCDAAIDALRRWAQWVASARASTRDLSRAASLVRDQARAELERVIPADQIARLEQTTSYWMNTWGYMRYFDKKEEPGPSVQITGI